MSNNAAEVGKPQAVSRIGLYLPVSLLLLLCGAWTAFWFFSAQKADAAITAWMSAEAGRGRAWTCDGKTIGGYPFRIELICNSAALRMKSSGDDLSMGRLHAVTQIYSPKLILVDLSGPLVSNDGKRAFQLDWDTLRLSVRLGARIERVSVAISEPKLNNETGLVLAAKRTELHLRPSAGGPEPDVSLDAVLSASGVSLMGLDALSVNQDKGSLELTLTATQALNISAAGHTHLLEAWRLAGGRLLIEKAKIGKGNVQIDAAGVLNLDAQRRPEGQLSLTAKGLRPLLSQLSTGNMAALIGPLLDRPEGVQLPMRLREGRMSIGPARLPGLFPPLY